MSRVTVEQEIDRALESALAELRGALVLASNEAAHGAHRMFCGRNTRAAL